MNSIHADMAARSVKNRVFIILCVSHPAGITDFSVDFAPIGAQAGIPARKMKDFSAIFVNYYTKNTNSPWLFDA